MAVDDGDAAAAHGDDDAMEDDDAMALDGAGPSGAGASSGGGGGNGRRGKVSPEFKSKVEQLLEANGFDTLRSSKMAQEDFLRLLATFNAAGIHFA